MVYYELYSINFKGRNIMFMGAPQKGKS
jgi:hypothetical protein